MTIQRVRTPIPREKLLDSRRQIEERSHRGELVWSNAVRELRLSLGMTQVEFAKMFRLTRKRVSEVENGRANLTIETLDRIGKPFGLTVGFVPRPNIENED